MADTEPARDNKWPTGLAELKAKSAEQGRRLFPYLPGIVGLIVVSLLAGWLGGRWAMRSVSPQPTPVSADRRQGSETTAPSDVDRPTDTDSPSMPESGDVPKKAYLGIRAKAVQKDGIQGVKITKVLPESPAEKAGLRADPDLASGSARPGESGGHIIIGANGLPIRSEEDLGRLLALSAPGNEITFIVTSADGGTYESIPVVLDAAQEREVAPGGLSPDQAAPPPTLPGAATALEAEVEGDILRAVNEARQERGLPLLRADQQLQRIARLHSQDMADRRFFSHFTPEGYSVVERLQTGGISGFPAVGENLFSKKKVADYPARTIVEEWLESASHRRNVLNARYSTSGVGVARGERGEIYVTQVFLAERDTKE